MCKISANANVIVLNRLRVLWERRSNCNGYRFSEAGMGVLTGAPSMPNCRRKSKSPRRSAQVCGIRRGRSSHCRAETVSVCVRHHRRHGIHHRRQRTAARNNCGWGLSSCGSGRSSCGSAPSSSGWGLSNCGLARSNSGSEPSTHDCSARTAPDSSMLRQTGSSSWASSSPANCCPRNSASRYPPEFALQWRLTVRMMPSLRHERLRAHSKLPFHGRLPFHRICRR